LKGAVGAQGALDNATPSGRCAWAVIARGLYAIVDTDTLQARGRDPVAFAQRLLAAGPLAALQLRAKSLSARDALALARALGPWCRAAGVPFVVNDRADLAWLAGADAVHVGQGDLPVDELVRRVPDLRVGGSSHSPAELAALLDTAADYVAYGPVFATQSKRDADPVVGLDGLRAAASMAAARSRPLVAIGGITLDNAAAVRDAGAWSGAVIGALVVPDAEVTAVARALHQRLGGAL